MRRVHYLANIKTFPSLTYLYKSQKSLQLHVYKEIRQKSLRPFLASDTIAKLLRIEDN